MAPYFSIKFFVCNVCLGHGDITCLYVCLDHSDTKWYHHDPDRHKDGIFIKIYRAIVNIHIVGVALELECIIETSLMIVSYHYISHYFNYTVIKMCCL